jgi:hypothetical protein
VSADRLPDSWQHCRLPVGAAETVTSRKTMRVALLEQAWTDRYFIAEPRTVPMKGAIRCTLAWGPDAEILPRSEAHRQPA